MIKPKKSVKKVVKKKEAPKKAAPKKATTTKDVVVTTKVASKKVEAPKKTAAKPVTAPKKGGKIVTSEIGGVGRRKSSVARVWLSKGKGNCVVNGKAIDTYFTTDQNRSDAVKALSVCQVQGVYTLKVNVKGGGPCSQAGAVRLGIARAMLKDNDSFKQTLKENGLLSVDSRVKERKKPGQRAARRKFQFVKR